jgi:2-polyprenyl-3-methyl-5-hydroxy-6-metoxy-1,4-benzoquinol methylase
MSSKKILPLNQSTSDLILKTVLPIKEKYISDKLSEQEINWVDTFNHTIKSSSWPTISGYDDFKNLPEYIKKECIHHHNFSDELFRQSIQKDANKLFDRLSELNVNPDMLAIVNNYVDLIKGKNIIDIGCNYGHWSLIAANLIS